MSQPLNNHAVTRSLVTWLSTRTISTTMRGSSVIPLTLAILALFSLLAAWLWPYTIDDAFISYRYALHIAQGHGPIWNLADQSYPVEGFTSFLHVWLLAGLAFVTGADVVFIGKFLGVVATGVLLLAVAREVQWYRVSGLAILVALSAFVLSFTALLSVSGMETSIYMLWYFLAVITALRLTTAPSAPMTWVFVSLGLLGTLTRPEFALPFLVMTVYLWWRSPSIRPTLWQALLVAYILPGLAVTAWRFSIYGDIVPNTFHVKQDQGITHWGINAGVMFVGYCAMPYLLIVAARWRHLWRTHRDFLILVGLNLAVSLAYFSTTFPYMNVAFRFLLPQVPALALLAAVSLNQEKPLDWGKVSARRALEFVLVALLVLSPFALIVAVAPLLDKWFGALLPVIHLLALLAWVVFFGDKARLGLPRPLVQTAGMAMIVLMILVPIPMLVRLVLVHHSNETLYREVGQRLRPFAAEDRWMVFHDVGALVYESEWNTIDVVGLNTRKENILSPCEMQTDLYLTPTHDVSRETPNPCPGLYTAIADLPFHKNALVENAMTVYARNDLTYSEELGESLLDGWPGPSIRQPDRFAWYFEAFSWVYHK